MKYTLGSSAPSYIFHNQHKTLNNLYQVVLDGQKVSEYEQEIQQSHTAEQPMAL